jgi:hypothetical protein
LFKSFQDRIYNAIGLLVVAWGRLEGHFLACLLMLLNFPEGTVLGAQVPPQWNKRAAMWRAAFQTFVALRPLMDAGLKFASEIEDVALARHFIVHSLWERFKPDGSLTIDVVTIKPKKKSKNGLEIHRREVKLDDLKEIRRRINELNMALVPLSQFITWHRSSQKPPPSDIRTI